MEFLLVLIGPGGGGFELFFPEGWGILPSKKLPGGFAWGGWSGLELTDTLPDLSLTYLLTSISVLSMNRCMASRCHNN